MWQLHMRQYTGSGADRQWKQVGDCLHSTTIRVGSLSLATSYVFKARGGYETLEKDVETWCVLFSFFVFFSPFFFLFSLFLSCFLWLAWIAGGCCFFRGWMLLYVSTRHGVRDVPRRNVDCFCSGMTPPLV